PLIVVDEQDTVPGPSQGDRELDELVLPLARLAMVEDLLGVGLPHINDGDSIEMKIPDLGRSPETGRAVRLGASRLGEDGRGAGWGRIKRAHGRPPLRREAWAVAGRRCD